MSAKKEFKDNPIIKFFTNNVLDKIGIGWQIVEWYNATIENALLDKSSINTLESFYDAVEGSLDAERINYIINKYSVKEPEDKKGFFTKVAENLKKLFTSKEDLEKRNAAILLLCLYKNINLIENAPEDDNNKELIKFLRDLHKVMQENIHIIFSLSDGKQALIYSTFFTSISFELQEIKKLIEAGVYQNKPILELEKDALRCKKCKADGQLKIVEENGITLVKAFCPNCGKVAFPNFSIINPNLEKGTGELTEEYIKEVQAIAKSISEKLDKIKETTEKIDKTTTETKEIVTEIKNIEEKKEENKDNYLNIKKEELKELILDEVNLDRKKIVACCEEILKLESDNLFVKAIKDLDKSKPKQYNTTISNIINKIKSYELNKEEWSLLMNYIKGTMSIGTENENTVTSALTLSSLVYDKGYISHELQKEIENCKVVLDSNIFNEKISRDIFVAYVSEDTNQVLKIVQELENDGFTCFFAARNIRHGEITENDYITKLHTALDYCKSILVVVTSNFLKKNNNKAIDYEIDYIIRKECKLCEIDPANYSWSMLKENQHQLKLRFWYQPNKTTSGRRHIGTIEQFFGGCNQINNIKDLSKIIGKSINNRKIEIGINSNNKPIETTPIFKESDEEKPLDKKPSDSEKLEMPKNSPIIPTRPTFIEQKKFKAGNQIIENGLKFTVNKDEKSVTVAGVTNKSIRNLYLPETVIGLTVNAIGSAAFYECKLLTELKIPSSVTAIGDYAFKWCSALTSIEIPNSVTSIGDCAFLGCSSLRSIIISNSITSIGDCAFYDCSSLTSITIPNSVTSIGDSAFYDCSALTSVTIPNSVTSIGRYAFSGCSSLTSVTIPNSVTSIDHCAFRGCSSLTSIEIPNSVTSIDHCAFQGCSKVTSITVSEQNKNYKSINGNLYSKDGKTLVEYAVGKNDNYYVIPNSVTSIGDYAFSYCSSLTSIEIPNSVTSIGDWAFGGCSALTSIEIPNSVTSIGDCAFGGCSALTNIKYNGTQEQWDKISKSKFWCTKNVKIIFTPKVVDIKTGDKITENNVKFKANKNESAAYKAGDEIIEYGLKFKVKEDEKSVTVAGVVDIVIDINIPSSVKGLKVDSIHYAAFRNSRSLKRIVIPNSVYFIGYQAFYGCSELSYVFISKRVTVISRHAFKDCKCLKVIHYEGTREQWKKIDKERGCKDLLTIIKSNERPMYFENKIRWSIY